MQYYAQWISYNKTTRKNWTGAKVRKVLNITVADQRYQYGIRMHLAAKNCSQPKLETWKDKHTSIKAPVNGTHQSKQSQTPPHNSASTSSIHSSMHSKELQHQISANQTDERKKKFVSNAIDLQVI